MINIYSTNKDNEGNIILDRTILFIREFDEEGNIQTFQSGNFFTPDTNGILLVVDSFIIGQIDKLIYKDGTLSVKQGSEIIEPVKSEKELQREALLKQLAELDSQPME